MKNAYTTKNFSAGVLRAGPKFWLHLEGLCWFIATLYFFNLQNYSWELFALLFLIPDISFAGYLLGTRIGAYSYNLMHSEVGPIILGVSGVMLASPVAVAVATIWMCHIGFDRMLGFGLKYSDDFKHTHLGFPFQR